MDIWSNIEKSLQDSEIVDIDNFEKGLRNISVNVEKIRELITRFEVCHFKYREHLKYIQESIRNLNPSIEPTTIGKYHISKGEEVLKNDKTKKSRLGQQYLYSLKNWLGDYLQINSEYFNYELNEEISKWLGDKNKDKERLVRLLVARLMWDWKSYENFQQGGEYKELEFQVCRMDICHYNFPKHLDRLLQGIGRMEPIENFEGCGSFNSEIKTYVEEQFLMLCDYLKLKTNENNLEHNGQIQIWLIASLAKTLKEQVGLKQSLPQLNNYLTN